MKSHLCSWLSDHLLSEEEEEEVEEKEEGFSHCPDSVCRLERRERQRMQPEELKSWLSLTQLSIHPTQLTKLF